MNELKLKNFTGITNGIFQTSAMDRKRQQLILFFIDKETREPFKMRAPKAWNFGEQGEEFIIYKNVNPIAHWEIEPTGRRIDRAQELHKQKLTYVNGLNDVVISTFMMMEEDEVNNIIDFVKQYKDKVNPNSITMLLNAGYKL